MKTSELEGDLLDAAVVVALGLTGNLTDGRAECHMIPFDTGPSDSRDGDTFEPSARWDHGGPVIDRERIDLSSRVPNAVLATDYWAARVRPENPELYGSAYWSVGPTPLIAAMRAFVASKLGDEVELP